MRAVFWIFVVIACCCWLGGLATAQVYLPVRSAEVTVCPAFETDSAPPAPTRAGCEATSLWRVDPQDTHIWLLLSLPVDALPSHHPIGLGLSAKASSLVYWNGELIGENGSPADTSNTEIAGKMDSVFPLKPSQIKPGDNSLALRMSSHAGFLHLGGPIHGIFLTHYVAPQDYRLRAYWPSILPFGAFALGALYFLTSAAIGRQVIASSLLGVMSLAAGVQLLAEVSRGLVAYTYPAHDLRLITIAGCSAVFGLCLGAYVVRQFRWQLRVPLMVGFVLLVAGALFFPLSLDTKASSALLAPTLLAAIIAFSAYGKARLNALAFGASLLVFAGINFFGASYFLDVYFYFAVALLLVFLFAQQARGFASEENARREEEARADKLQYVLDQLRAEEDDTTLSIKTAGRITALASKDIAYIKAAGDYAELTLPSGETMLHHATLTDLETELPAYFLRVHRSYLVNSKLIASLERHAAGTGELKLTSDQTLPVSRRIMPKIRAALFAA